MNSHESNKSFSQVTEKITFEKTFTTAPKHRQGTIRRTCMAFIDRLRHDGNTMMPVEEAKDLFSDTVDKWDRLTLRSYFGSQKGTAKKSITRTARYASGVTSNKWITLEQHIPVRRGYLEKLGLVSYEWVSDTRTWWLIVNPESLVSELGQSSTSVKEASHGVSMANLYLSPNVARQDVGVVAVQLGDTRREKRESV